MTTLGEGTGTPRWSPDSQRIAFDSEVEGQSEIYVVSANGGKPQNLTNNPSTEIVPSWSRDGKWIYFASNRSGDYQVWKKRIDGREEVQLTRQGGTAAFESADGKALYYAKGLSATSLWKVSAESGEETQILDSLNWLLDFAGCEGWNLFHSQKPS